MESSQCLFRSLDKEMYAGALEACTFLQPPALYG